MRNIRLLFLFRNKYYTGIQYSDEQFNDLDLFAQLGKPCFINVTLNDTGEYNNIDSVTPPMQGYPIPTTATPFIKWDMDEWNDAAFEALPEWAQEKIKKSTQYQKAHPPTTTIDFSTLSAAQVQQSAAPAVQPAQSVQQAAPVAQSAQVAPVQQSAPQVQQGAYAAPAAPSAVNPQAYQMSAPAAPVVQQTAPVAQQEGAPF